MYKQDNAKCSALWPRQYSRVSWQFCGLLLCLACTSCAPSGSYCKNPCRVVQADSSRISQRLLLIGDTGKLTKKAGKGIKRKVLLRTVEHYLAAVPARTTVVFLGDNIYPLGLPDEDQLPVKQDFQCTGRACAEQRLDVQLDLLVRTGVRGIFIPGNHDWNREQRGGWHRLMNLQQYINRQQRERNIQVSLLPGQGCPGPSRLVLPAGPGNGLVLIVLDTQWWLHAYEKPDRDNPAGCAPVTEAGIIKRLEQQLEAARQNHRQVVVVGHHVLQSNGKHAGYISPDLLASPSDVFSQLRNRTRWAHSQYLAHPVYQHMRQQLETVFSSALKKGLRPIVYASGHDHSLQVLISKKQKLPMYYLVSGLGSGSEHLVGHDERTLFSYVAETGGFMVLDMLENGETRLAAIAPENKHSVCVPARGNCEIFSTYLRGF